MNTVQSAPTEFKPGLAIGSGMLAGFATLGVLAGMFWVLGRSNDGAGITEVTGRELGSSVVVSDLEPGDCIDRQPAPAENRYKLLDCNTPHQAQVTIISKNPEDGEAPYPGEEAFADWLTDECQPASEDFLGVPVLETILATRADLPNDVSWAAGTVNAVCYIEPLDSSPLEQSLEDSGADFPRGSTVAVSRLLLGDCFVPADDVGAYDLNSNSDTRLVDCSGEHNGVFFGRERLDFGPTAEFPGQDEVGGITSELCAGLFEDAYGISAEGFNYRYWRPNQASWDAGDRGVLCAILDAQTLSEEFDPKRHRRFFDLDVGDCFNLGPEETSESLRLDDQVRLVDCNIAHIGQMIGSGNLDIDASEPFSNDQRVLRLAAAECEQLFADFVGISPFESEFRLNSPIWYPNEQGWEDGDRRFACAYLGDEPRIDSLENAKT